jgi:outer membrane protein insertion porin family
VRRAVRIARGAPPLARAGALAALLAAALVGPSPARAQFEGEDEPQVEKVEILGNAAYEDGVLQSILRTRARSFFRPWRSAPLRNDFLRFDRVVLRDFYRRHGYLDARVDSVEVVHKSERSVQVRFYVEEGVHATVASLDFTGIPAAEEEDVRGAIPLTAGGPFDFPLLETSLAAIESLYVDRGHVAVSARDSVEVVPGGVRVRFDLVPGPRATLRQVQVEGTRTTKPGFVSREVTLRRGDVLARSKLVRSQQRIYDSGLYSDVQFSAGAIDSATHETDLVVAVRERRLGWVDAGVGYGTVDQVRLTAQVGQRNLFRDGVHFVLSGRFGIRAKSKPQFPYVKDIFGGDRRADVSLTRDWLLGFRVRGTVGAYAEDIRITTLDARVLKIETTGASGGLRYELDRWSSTSLLYEARHVISDTTSLLTPVGTGLGSYNTNRIVVGVERDTRLDLFDPRGGSNTTGSAEFVGGVLRGQSKYLKLSGSGALYRSRGRTVTFAVRARAGLITSRGQGPAVGLEDSLSSILFVPIDDRFRLGGPTSVRGYSDDEIGKVVTNPGDPVLRDVEFRGGSCLLLANAEIRTRLIGFFGLAAFVDAGNVWERTEDISWRRTLSFSNGSGYNDMRYTAGLGIRVNTPVGPVRLDYGWKLRIARPDQPDPVTGRGAFAFSLGQAF